MRWGVFGGTFDPVHLGHLVSAAAAADQLALDGVLFVPAGSPPHKLGEAMSSGQHRAAMLDLAVAGDLGWRVHRVDLDRPGPHYTVDMLRLLHAELDPAELFFLMGADSLAELTTWRAPEEIVALATPVVVPRLGFPALSAPLPDIAGLAEHLVALEMPEIGVSATDIRARVAAGRGIRHLVPRAVEDYLRVAGLYRAFPTV